MQIIERLSSQVGDRTAQSNMRVAVECVQNPDYLKEIETGLLSSDVKLIGDCAEVFTEVAKEKPEL
jgi:hypothetical protein